MNDFKIKGLLNQHLKISYDESNVSNNNNAVIYSQILTGNYSSPEFEYLLNLAYMRLSDVKSIGMYNEMNLAAQLNATEPLPAKAGRFVLLLKQPKVVQYQSYRTSFFLAYPDF